jgi:hypothetical protein
MFTLLLVTLFGCAVLLVQDLVLCSVGRGMKWRMMRWRVLTAIVVGAPLIVVIVLLWPPLSASQFEAKGWKSGNRWSRGAMVQDLIDRNLLVGKSRSEILEVLGQPDYCAAPDPSSISSMANAKCSDPRVHWFGYRVVTNLRCNYFWECRMDVNFNKTTYRVEELTVSD